VSPPPESESESEAAGELDPSHLGPRPAPGPAARREPRDRARPVWHDSTRPDRYGVRPDRYGDFVLNLSKKNSVTVAEFGVTNRKISYKSQL
jgi:hypothetical protein